MISYEGISFTKIDVKMIKIEPYTFNYRICSKYFEN